MSIKREDFHLPPVIMTKAAVKLYLRNHYRISWPVDQTLGHPCAEQSMPFGMTRTVYYFEEPIAETDILYHGNRLSRDDAEILVPRLWKHLNPFERTVIIRNNQPISGITSWFKKNCNGRVLVMPLETMTYAGFESEVDFVKAKLTWP